MTVILIRIFKYITLTRFGVFLTIQNENIYYLNRAKSKIKKSKRIFTKLSKISSINFLCFYVVFWGVI